MPGSRAETRYVPSPGVSIRCWEDACVVFHPLRNETHMLGLLAGDLLKRLQDAGVPAPIAALGAGEHGPAEDEMQALLGELADVGLVEARLA